MMMTALVKQGSRVALRQVWRPVPDRDEVLVRVVVAGVCRTDLHVADGRIPGPEPLILGHEFSGVVEAAGPDAGGCGPGCRVAVSPIIPCLDCERCFAGDAINCGRRAMLGVDRDGAFAEYVCVPGRCVWPLPNGASFAAGAYAEPIAAALGVLNAAIHPLHRGVILGNNRFAALTQRVLECQGFKHLARADPAKAAALPGDAFDFVIETALTTETLREMVRLARPRGTLVLKSRQPGLVGLDVNAALRKQLTLRAVQYGHFVQAMGLLARDRLSLDGLLGPAYPLADFAQVFARASHNESAKLFFHIAADHVWDR
jgi:L-iditol 2-dehydrogenase